MSPLACRAHRRTCARVLLLATELGRKLHALQGTGTPPCGTRVLCLLCCDPCFARRLREEAAAAGQDALTQALRHDPPHAYIAHVAHMTAALDSLVAAVQGAHSSSKQLGPPGTAAAVLQGGSRGAIRSGGSRPNSRGGLLGGAQGSSMLALCEGFGDASLPWGGVCGDLSWSKGVVLRLKEMLLESDRWVGCWGFGEGGGYTGVCVCGLPTATAPGAWWEMTQKGVTKHSHNMCVQVLPICVKQAKEPAWTTVTAPLTAAMCLWPQNNRTRRMYMSARLEADVVSNQAASLSAQLAACQASEDRATALWQAAERAKQAVLRGVEQRDAAAAAFALERMQAQVRGGWAQAWSLVLRQGLTCPVPYISGARVASACSLTTCHAACRSATSACSSARRSSWASSWSRHRQAQAPHRLLQPQHASRQPL